MSGEAKKTQTILGEAAMLVYGDRESDYGHPRDDFSRTARLWNAWLEGRPNRRVGADDVAAMMILLKMSRQCHKVKRDNLVDMAGYVATWSRAIGEDE